MLHKLLGKWFDFYDRSLATYILKVHPDLKLQSELQSSMVVSSLPKKVTALRCSLSFVLTDLVANQTAGEATLEIISSVTVYRT